MQDKRKGNDVRVCWFLPALLFNNWNTLVYAGVPWAGHCYWYVQIHVCVYQQGMSLWRRWFGEATAGGNRDYRQRRRRPHFYETL